MEIGKMIEMNQIKKLKSLGIFLGTQDRLYDEECNVSGRLDALLVSPDHCSAFIKKMIQEKRKIYESLKETENNLWKGINSYREWKIIEKDLIKGKKDIVELQHYLYEKESDVDKNMER